MEMQNSGRKALPPEELRPIGRAGKNGEDAPQGFDSERRVGFAHRFGFWWAQPTLQAYESASLQLLSRLIEPISKVQHSSDGSRWEQPS